MTTYTDVYATSSHLLGTTKVVAFHSMIYKLINLPMNKKDFNNELILVKQIAVESKKERSKIKFFRIIRN